MLPISYQIYNKSLYIYLAKNSLINDNKSYINIIIIIESKRILCLLLSLLSPRLSMQILCTSSLISSGGELLLTGFCLLPLCCHESSPILRILCLNFNPVLPPLLPCRSLSHWYGLWTVRLHLLSHFFTTKSFSITRSLFQLPDQLSLRPCALTPPQLCELAPSYYSQFDLPPYSANWVSDREIGLLTGLQRTCKIMDFLLVDEVLEDDLVPVDLLMSFTFKLFHLILWLGIPKFLLYLVQ